MVNVIQYPDVLTYYTKAASSITYDNDGNAIVTNTQGQLQTIKCRAEDNANGKYLIGEDGKQLKYDWTIYMPNVYDVIPHGSVVEIKRDGIIRAKGAIMRCVVNQLNAMAWL